MCGIAGIFAYRDDAAPVDEAELLRIRERMTARGPDGAGLWLGPSQRIGLAHRRLAVIDLSPGGAQPMASVDGRYQIVFNGEIYNYRELRDSLMRRGAVFRTKSDTEVLLQLFECERAAMLPRLRGMFAFGIWDAFTQSLFLARDPFGIKPLYVNDDGQTLRFASQVKALAAGGVVSSDRDPDAEVDYWVWGHIPEPRTVLKHVRALEPGTWLRLERGGRRQVGVFESLERLFGSTRQGNAPFADADRYRLQETQVNVVSSNSCRDWTLREALLDTVRHHLVSDVPVGVFLSAGIDSATLTALAVECGGSLQTLTLGFDEYRGTAADETLLSQEIARRYGTRHETVWIGRTDFERLQRRFFTDMDQPSIDGLNTWLVSWAAKQAGLKVVMSGLGGDELFGGYPSFRQLPALRWMMAPTRLWPVFGRAIRRATAPLLRRVTNEKYAGLIEYGGTWAGAYLLRRAVRMPWQVAHGERTSMPKAPDLGSDFSRVSFLESSLYMRNQLLRDSDWASMSHSIELRVPLIDVRLMNCLASQWRTGRPYGKRALASVAQPALPADLIQRSKTGFTVPVREWLQASGGVALKDRGIHAWQSAVWKTFVPGS